MKRFALIFPLFLILTPSLGADDGAASIAAGGIILMKREPRIVMAKEVLRISPGKVHVDYEFRNDSDQDITTLVAFPVPPYKYGDSEEVYGDPGFEDFKLTVEGSPKAFKKEVRAFVGKREITTLLAPEHVDAATFGHSDQHEYGEPADLKRIGSAAHQRLSAAGALDGDEPIWRVEKKYYWPQTFPARQVVRIGHQYSPVLGGTNNVRYGLEAPSRSKQFKTELDKALAEDEKYLIDEMNSLCFEPNLKQYLLKTLQKPGMRIPFDYVDFILTTANTWKTPIEDFTLIVERPTAAKSNVAKPTASNRWDGSLVSFCWNGPIEKTDATHFTAHLKNFFPTKELRVGFLSVEHIDPDHF